MSLTRTRNAPTNGKRQRTGPRSSKRKASIFRPLPIAKGFPKMMNFKHSYVEVVLMSAPALGFLDFNFSTNGMFDPNVTGIGHQPYYFDQLAGLYDHYTVLSSKIKYTFLADSLSTPAPYQVTTWVNDDTVATGGTAVRENPTAKTLLSGGSNPMVVTASHDWNTYDVFGPSPMANSKLLGDAATNPEEQQFFAMRLRANDFVTAVSVWVKIEIDYTAAWTELKEQTTS